MELELKSTVEEEEKRVEVEEAVEGATKTLVEERTVLEEVDELVGWGVEVEVGVGVALEVVAGGGV